MQNVVITVNDLVDIAVLESSGIPQCTGTLSISLIII